MTIVPKSWKAYASLALDDSSFWKIPSTPFRCPHSTTATAFCFRYACNAIDATHNEQRHDQ